VVLLTLILKPYPVLFNRFVKGLMARQNHKGLKEIIKWIKTDIQNINSH
jgi:hypothetical protein